MSEIAITDARPLHKLSDTTSWDRAEQLRDSMHDAMEATERAESVSVSIVRSPAGTYPPSVEMEAWLPGQSEREGSLRSVLTIWVEAAPHRRNSCVVSVRLERAGRAIAVAQRPDFTLDDAREWMLHALDRGAKPSSYTPVQDALVNMFRAFVPFVQPLHANPIVREFPENIPFSGFMAIGACLLVAATATFDGESLVFPIALLLLAGAVYAIALRRPVSISVVDRPRTPPRNVSLVDSWHTVVPDLGAQLTDLARRIEKSLAPLESSSVEVERETYAFRGPNGIEQRERLVVSKGQAIAHVHTYRFGSDIFIGWESYLNWAKWGETVPVWKKVTMADITEYRGLTPVFYLPNQYDLIDLNSLTEVVHQRVTAVVKRMMEEHRIDREIDFTILRGDRDRALDKERFDRRSKQSDAGAQRGRWKIS
jgi:hypothetical protein